MLFLDPLSIVNFYIMCKQLLKDERLSPAMGFSQSVLSELNELALILDCQFARSGRREEGEEGSEKELVF